MEAMLEQIAHVVTGVITGAGYFGVAFLMALESACIPVPSELVMPYAGFLVSKGTFGFWAVVFWGVVGQTVGSVITYWFGSTGGRVLLEKYGKYVLIKKHHIAMADRWFERFGPRIVLFGRVVPVIRTFISLPAGLSEMSFRKFLIYSVVGIIPWTIFLTYLGVYLGDNWAGLSRYFHGADIIVAAALLGGIAYLVYKKKNANDRKPHSVS